MTAAITTELITILCHQFKFVAFDAIRAARIVGRHWKNAIAYHRWGDRLEKEGSRTL
jgi:hypothetical protein